MTDSPCCATVAMTITRGMRIAIALCAAFAATPSSRRRRSSRIRKHRGHRQGHHWRHRARRHRDRDEPRAQDRRYRRVERVGALRQGSPAAGNLRGQGGARGLQDRGRARGPGERRHTDADRLRADDRSGQRADRSDGRIALAENRSRRRLHQLRFEADHRVAGARSQLHQVHPVDPGHAAAAVAARREREPAGLHADDGQRPAFQRHGLSTRRDGEPRSDPRHHRHQSHAGVDRGNEDHVAELRRRVRPGDGRRGVGADQVGPERDVRQRLRVPPERPVPVAQSVHAVPARPADRRVPAGDEPGSVRRLAGGQDRREPGVLLRRLSGHAQHRRRLAAADRADGRGPQRRSQRLWRQHLRPGHGRAGGAAAVCRQRDSHGPTLATSAGAAPADSGPQRGRPRQRHEGQLRGVGIRSVRRELVQRPHRRPHQQPHEYLWPLQLREVLPGRPDGVRRGRRSGAGEPGRAVESQEPEPRLRHRQRPVADAAGRFPVRLVQVQGQRAAVRFRHDAGHRRRDSRSQRGQHVQFRTAGRIRRGGPRLQLRFGTGRQPLQLPARSGRNAVAAGGEPDESASARTTSRPASTSGARTISGCRATRTAPAS